MTKHEMHAKLMDIYREVTPEMTSEETCRALEELCTVLDWIIEKLPEEE